MFIGAQQLERCERQAWEEEEVGPGLSHTKGSAGPREGPNWESRDTDTGWSLCHMGWSLGGIVPGEEACPWVGQLPEDSLSEVPDAGEVGDDYLGITLWHPLYVLWLFFLSSNPSFLSW